MDQVVIAVIVSFFGYILYGAAGFGAAMIFHSLWTLLEMANVTDGSVESATYYLNIMTLNVTLIMSYNNRDLIQWDFVFVCTVPWFCMNVIGCYLLIGTSNETLKGVLGIILFFIFLYQTIKTLYLMLSGRMLHDKLNKANDDSEEEIPLVDLGKSYMWLTFVGCGGGILSGLFNMPGPATIIVLLFAGIHRERWKANFFTWQIPAQFFVVWFLSDRGDLFEADMWPWYIVMSISAVIASKIGNWLAQYLSQTTFTFVVIALSCLGAVSDLSVILPEEWKYKLVGSGFLFAIVLLIVLFVILYYYVEKPLKEIRRSGDVHLDDSYRLDTSLIDDAGAGQSTKGERRI